MVKASLRRVHLLLALVSALFILSLSISGALLVYAKDIQAIINPNFWLVNVDKFHQQTPLPLSQLIKEVNLPSDVKIKIIEREEDPNKAWSIRLTNSNYLNVNPYTGQVLLQHSFYDTFYGFIMSWHRWLLYKSDSEETPLKVWMSIASLILIFELILGTYLWIKPKKRLKRLRIKWRSKTKVLFYQLHTSLGVFTCIPLILIAFSGMSFQWQPATKQIVEWLSLSEIESYRFERKRLPTSDSYNIDNAYRNAQSALPEGFVYRIYLPAKVGDPLALRIKMPSESHAYSWSWADPHSGDLLDSFDASKTSAATKVWNFKYKFHIGEFLAWPVKVLWLILSLIPSFFVISGLYLFFNRKQKRNT